MGCLDKGVDTVILLEPLRDVFAALASFFSDGFRSLGWIQ